MKRKLQKLNKKSVQEQRLEIPNMKTKMSGFVTMIVLNTTGVHLLRIKREDMDGTTVATEKENEIIL